MRELRIYTGLPWKGKETRTLGRDRRRPSGHDPPPGWVGGFFYELVVERHVVCMP
jgi:hypothetical protein